MSQTSCCVSGCTSTAEKGARLHHFPNPETDIERFRTWVMKIGRDIVGLENNYIYKNRRVCIRHFEPMYVYTKKLSTMAIPLLHLPGVPAHRQVLPPLPAGPISREVVAPAPVSPVIASEVNVHPTESQQTAILKRRVNTHKKMTKTEKELQDVVKKTQNQIQKLQKCKKDYKAKLALTKKMLNHQAYETVTKCLNPAAKTFFGMQVKQGRKKAKGRRFTLDEKILALTLYKPSPKAYRILRQICVLPHRRTLDKMLTKINLIPGINDILFQHLKERVKKMPNAHKYCNIIFDEMAISPQLSYDGKEDIIKGFCDNGKERNNKFCDHVLVFMVRGVFKKYKQPVSFSFCCGTTKTENLTEQIKEIVKKVQETGLKVISTICDQGATNIAAINALLRETKENHLRKCEEWRGGFYEINEEKIFHIFDPPHLIKGIRNNLLNKNLDFVLEGKQKTAKWSHLQALLRRGPNYRGVRMVPKLTERHVVPSLIPKMRVKHATQVFSRSVGVALGFMAEVGKLPEECKDTADLILLFDNLFDSVNGSYSKPLHGKIYRSAVTPKSPHHKLWRKYLPVLKSMKFVSPNGRKGSVPSIESWIKTIDNFELIIKKLQSEGITSLLLRNFNQDPLENFFGAIRAHGHSNIMPCAASFINSYKILLINNISSHNSVGANCEDDKTECLQSLKYFLTLPQQNQNNETLNVVHEDHLNIVFDANKVLENTGFEEKEKCAAAAYCCGWLLNISKKRIIKNCKYCEADLECSQEEEFHRFIAMKKYSESSWLHYPTREFLKLFLQIENIVNVILQKNGCMENVSSYCKLIISIYLDSNFIKCGEHKDDLLKFLINRSVKFFINNYLKEINNLLSGKSAQWDKNDVLKSSAYAYCEKHKKNVRIRATGVALKV